MLSYNINRLKISHRKYEVVSTVHGGFKYDAIMINSSTAGIEGEFCQIDIESVDLASAAEIKRAILRWFEHDTLISISVLKKYLRTCIDAGDKSKILPYSAVGVVDRPKQIEEGPGPETYNKPEMNNTGTDVQGISLRDYFAGQCLASIATATSPNDAASREATAKAAYLQADAMLKIRNGWG